MVTMKRKKIANPILLLVISAMQDLGNYTFFWLEFGQPYLVFQPKMSLKEEMTFATWWKPTSQVRLEGAGQFKIFKSSQ